jgi:hypothetical protein
LEARRESSGIIRRESKPGGEGDEVALGLVLRSQASEHRVPVLGLVETDIEGFEMIQSAHGFHVEAITFEADELFDFAQMDGNGIGRVGFSRAAASSRASVRSSG